MADRLPGGIAALIEEHSSSDFPVSEVLVGDGSVSSALKSVALNRF